MGQVSQEDQAKWARRVSQGKRTMYDKRSDALSAAERRQDPTDQKGSPQSDYAKNYGDARKMQQDDLNQKIASDVQSGYDKAAGKKVPSYKKGGMVKKTGLAKVHAGEKVIRKQDVKRTVKAVRKYGGKR